MGAATVFSRIGPKLRQLCVDERTLPKSRPSAPRARCRRKIEMSPGAQSRDDTPWVTGLSSSGTESRMSASFWSKSVAGGCPMLGQDRDNDIARVEQDGFLLVRGELDEAQSPEQEKSFNGQQSVTNVMGIA